MGPHDLGEACTIYFDALVSVDKGLAYATFRHSARHASFALRGLPVNLEEAEVRGSCAPFRVSGLFIDGVLQYLREVGLRRDAPPAKKTPSDRSLDACAAALGMSRTNVRRIEAGALRKMRDELERRGYSRDVVTDMLAGEHRPPARGTHER